MHDLHAYHSVRMYVDWRCTVYLQQPSFYNLFAGSRSNPNEDRILDDLNSQHDLRSSPFLNYVEVEFGVGLINLIGLVKANDAFPVRLYPAFLPKCDYSTLRSGLCYRKSVCHLSSATLVHPA